MSKGEVTHLCSRVNLGADSLEDRRRVAVDLSPAIEAESRRPGPLLRQAHHNVLGHREVREQGLLLVNDADADGIGILRTAQTDSLAVNGDRALVRPMSTGEDLEQGGLARTVFAE